MAATLQDIASDLAPTGVLRASINPVLAPGTASDPSGVTVARRSFDAMVAGDADICFLAVEPAREAEVAFTPAYVVIEGVFAVPAESPVQASADVDRPGVRIGVERGSAYDLYLTRTLRHAEIVRGEEGTTVFLDEHLDVRGGHPAAPHRLRAGALGPAPGRAVPRRCGSWERPSRSSRRAGSYPPPWCGRGRVARPSLRLPELSQQVAPAPLPGLGDPETIEHVFDDLGGGKHGGTNGICVAGIRPARPGRPPGRPPPVRCSG